jgi:hypothetical protein
MIKKIFGSQFKLFAMFFVFGAGITLASGLSMQFHATGIDFWTILYYGRHMTLSEPESLYNGFYPIGYAFLIGQLPFTYILPLAYILNALLAGFFTASVSTLVAASRSFPAILIACFSSVAAPFVFNTANTLSPDIGSVAFTAFAIFLLWRDRFEEIWKDPDDLCSVLIGASLGLAFLWRTHAIVSSAAILFSYFLLAGIRPFRSRMLMVGIFAFFVSLQVTVNLLSGHGALETTQAYNIYKFFYGSSGGPRPLTSEDIEKFSIMDAVMRDPQAAVRQYINSFGYLLSFAWPAFTGFLLSPKGRLSRYSLFSVIFVLLYAIPVTLGDSPRAPVILMSAYTSTLALLIVVLTERAKKLFNSIQWMEGIVALLFVAAGFQSFYGWVVDNLDFVRINRNERIHLALIEQVLISNGMRVPTEVYADRYDFYTPNVMPYRSHQIGDWPEEWVWGFKDEFPLLPNDSWNAFAEACKEQGIRFLVLSPNSRYRGDIFPVVYNEDGRNLELFGLRFIAQRGNTRIFKFK